MSKLFKPRRGTVGTMSTTKSNIILEAGELFAEVPNTGAGTGKGRLVMGDGTTVYSELPSFIENTEPIQVSTLPTADASYVNKVYQYIGTTGNGLNHGYFYECVSDDEAEPTYSWSQINIQPGSAGITTLSQTLAVGSTSVTFTNVPTTGNNLIEFFTSNGANYTDIDASTAGEITLTFEAQSEAVIVYCKIEEV